MKRYADDLISVLESGCYSDKAIVRNVRYWAGLPVTYTMATFHPNIEYGIVRKDSSNFDRLMRSRAIVSLLRPLFLYQGEIEYDVSVILDDNIWKQTIEHCGCDIEGKLEENRIKIDFSIVPSRKAYGLQLADLIVGVVKDYCQSGLCEKAFSKIAGNTIYHIGRRAIETVSPLDRG